MVKNISLAFESGGSLTVEVGIGNNGDIARLPLKSVVLGLGDLSLYLIFLLSNLAISTSKKMLNYYQTCENICMYIVHTM